MIEEATKQDTIDVPDAPAIPGLSFRRFRSDSDFPNMVAIQDASFTADNIDWVITVEEMVQMFANMKNFDPYQDILIAEVEGEPVAFNRWRWWTETNGSRVYSHAGWVVPAWRGKGLGITMMRYAEARLREKAARQPEATRLLSTWIMSTQTGLEELLLGEGYKAVRFGYEMVRPNLDDIPDLPLPEGIEVRPVQPEHLYQIWEAETEAFLEHWGEQETEESDFERWQAEPHFQPHLWQVAWDGDQVVGMIRNFIIEEENAKFNRLRGFTEAISVRAPWRKRGIARALLARSFRMHKELGMTEAALGVDTENATGALQLYESMGFQVVKQTKYYRKPMV